MKPRLYLETTIPSYLISRRNRNVVVAGHQEITRLWWERRRQHYELYVSALVRREVSAGNAELARERLAFVAGLPVLEITDSVAALSELLLKRGIVPDTAATDAGHIALAAVHGMHYLLTWNCAHIANAAVRDRIRLACEELKFECPIVCTPEMLMEG